MWLTIVCVFLCACGRLRFDPRSDADTVVADASVGLVQEATSHANNVTMLTVSLSAPVTAGDLVILAASTDTGISDIASIVGGGVIWNRIASVPGLGPGCPCLRGALWYATGAAGDTIVTITFVGIDDAAVSVAEWSGFASVNRFVTLGPSTTADVMTGGVSANQGELVLAMGAWDKSTIVAGPTNGFTALTPGIELGKAYVVPAWKIATSAGLHETGWMLSGNTQAWAGLAASFTPI